MALPAVHCGARDGTVCPLLFLDKPSWLPGPAGDSGPSRLPHSRAGLQGAMRSVLQPQRKAGGHRRAALEDMGGRGPQDARDRQVSMLPSPGWGWASQQQRTWAGFFRTKRRKPIPAQGAGLAFLDAHSWPGESVPGGDFSCTVKMGLPSASGSSGGAEGVEMSPPQTLPSRSSLLRREVQTWLPRCPEPRRQNPPCTERIGLPREQQLPPGAPSANGTSTNRLDSWIGWGLLRLRDPGP